LVEEEELLGSGAAEEAAACDDVEENTSSTENVSLGREGLSVQNFWCNIARCPTLVVDLKDVVGLTRKTKVGYCDPQVLLVVNQNVLRLDVSVDNAVLMQKIKREEELLHQHSDLAFGDLRAMRLHELKYRSVPRKVHHYRYNLDVTAGLPRRVDAIDLDDVVADLELPYEADFTQDLDEIGNVSANV
jgi:hypothetical protein